MNPGDAVAAAAIVEAGAQEWRDDQQYRPCALPDHLSPCAIDAEKGAQRHRCSRHHADLVEEYRRARHVYLLRLEEDTNLWPTEVAEHRQHTPPVTLRAWLQQNRTDR